MSHMHLIYRYVGFNAYLKPACSYLVPPSARPYKCSIQVTHQLETTHIQKWVS